MIELQDGILLYHGSYIGIPEIDLNRCFGGLDFGRGFYLTSSYEQAYNYVHLSTRKAIRIGTGILFSGSNHRMAPLCSCKPKKRFVSTTSEKV